MVEIEIREPPKVSWMDESPKAEEWNPSINIAWPPHLWSLRILVMIIDLSPGFFSIFVVWC